MNPDQAEQYIQELEKLITKFRELRSGCKDGDFIHLDQADRQWLLTRARSAIERISGKGQVHHRHAEEIFSNVGEDWVQARSILGVIEGLCSDLKEGHLKTFSELLHAELFGDLLDTAFYLLSEGYVDAASVTAGSTLEAHLKTLCKKNGIPIDHVNASGRTVPNKAETMNQELAKALVYQKTDQKYVTAWLGTRNDAAHPGSTKPDSPTVADMIKGIRDFVSRNPA